MVKFEPSPEAPPPQLSHCWAKTDPLTALPALTVRDHCLIVGMVAELARPLLPASSSALCPAGTSTLIAAHDIGKISPGFQAKSPYFTYRATGLQECSTNHAAISQAYLASLKNMQDASGAPFNWTLAADGHHGRYNLNRARKNLGARIHGINEGEANWPQPLRDELLEELVRLFGELPHGPIQTGATLHWLTGFTTFCDWIGSNTEWFPLIEDGVLCDQYTAETARDHARRALDLIGWHRRSVRPSLTFHELFADISAQRFEPRPLQRALIDLSTGPGLYIVEAPMGMGKTEAALAAAYRRWTEGDERGLYFALPTQLTSNRIHQRVTQFLERVVADETIEALVHGNSWLRDDRLHSFTPAPTGGSEDDASEATRWFASTRKAMLAPFGTGTIDQALMARIAVKHSALRLFGLSGKVVVMDEVHSYDPYTSKLIDLLIPWLLEAGCSIFILSATLSARRRREMMIAAGSSPQQKLPDAYPLITKVAKNESPLFQSIDGTITTDSQVTLEHLDATSPDINERIVRAAEAGACVLCIRNTVASAQQTFRHLKSEMRGDSITIGLLHSRFPQFTRDDSEDRWMQLLGKDDSRRPAGCILVATQVVEQSVDIDADLLVTDLAPTDLLLQRIGRLHRHPQKRPNGFKNPLCLILHPEADWNATAKAIRTALGATAYVYPPVTLFQAQRVWRDRHSITLPSEIRSLIEASELNQLPNPLPPGVRQLQEKLDDEVRNKLGAANRQNPFHQPSVTDAEGAQTRWISQPTALLVLLREIPVVQGSRVRIATLDGANHEMIRGLFHFPLATSLHQSAVRIPAYLVKGTTSPDWLALHVREAVCAVVSTDSNEILIMGLSNPPYHLHYQHETGISYERIRSIATPIIPGDENDFWY
jgi:CRISPR-associated endonuclease/helicase Cas3